MYKYFFAISFSLLLSITGIANESVDILPKHKLFSKHWRKIKTAEKHNKLVAIGLDLTLGLVGAHRLYLGTAAHIPIVYALTLGGGGFLVVSDLIAILVSKDLEHFENNSKIVMW